MPTNRPTAIIEAPKGGPYDLFDAVMLAKEVQADDWVIEIPIVGELLEKFAAVSGVRVFRLDDVPGSLFATNAELQPGKAHVVVDDGVIGSLVEGPDADCPDASTITKVLKTAEERYVLGVVLSPETEDSQGDVYSAAEVRKAAHGFMEHAGVLGKQHREVVDRDKLRVLESYIAPADFEQDGEKVLKGTWLLGIRVVDDSLWNGIKKGEFTGFSIGGHAYRRPETQS